MWTIDLTKTEYLKSQNKLRKRIKQSEIADLEIALQTACSAAIQSNRPCYMTIRNSYNWAVPHVTHRKPHLAECQVSWILKIDPDRTVYTASRNDFFGLSN